jgi:L-ascorbate metabolism protein UlaG (beta-lactamase superfamily)
MDIRRLGWAGIELTSAETTLVIDMIGSFGALEPLLAGAPTPLPAPSRAVDAALVTHLHEDHIDAAAIAAALRGSGPVLRPHAVPVRGLDAVATRAGEQGLLEHGLETDSLQPWETRVIGPFSITALPAVDGFGDPQVSWLVEADGQRVLHAGDTTFHGSWWSIALRSGPIDVAFLPINGPVCSFPHRQPPTPFPAAMDPRQAAVAAHILGARRVVPMHYDGVHAPPFYAQVDDPSGSFSREAATFDLAVTFLAPGETLGTAGRPGAPA